MSDDDIQYIIDNYYNKTASFLANKFNVSRSRIEQIWRNNNLHGKIRDNSNIGHNLLGQNFGYLKVILPSTKRASNGGKYWICECHCGRPDCLVLKEILGTSLLDGSTISCGSLSKESLNIGRGLNINDLTGQKFGLLTVIERCDDYITPTGKKSVQWKCKCDCGKETIILSSNLVTGNTQSCGLCKNNSHGNNKIAKLLDENDIKYIREKRFETCKDINMLPFDFYVEDKYLIEFDGKQHYDNNNNFLEIIKQYIKEM